LSFCLFVYWFFNLFFFSYHHISGTTSISPFMSLLFSATHNHFSAICF